MSKEYIERGMVLEYLNADREADLQPEVVMEFVESIPAADVVEVVRCKDCKHLNPVEGGIPLCTLHRIGRVYEEFCSNGERKEGADNG